MSYSVQPRPQGAFPWLWPGKSVLVYEVVVASYLAPIFYYIADSMKVALDIGNCALTCNCLVITQANYCSSFRIYINA